MSAGLFDLAPEEQVRYVACLMGCSPNHEESWPRAIIDKLLQGHKAEAERALMDSINRMMPAGRWA